MYNLHILLLILCVLVGSPWTDDDDGCALERAAVPNAGDGDRHLPGHLAGLAQGRSGDGRGGQAEGDGRAARGAGEGLCDVHFGWGSAKK